MAVVQVQVDGPSTPEEQQLVDGFPALDWGRDRVVELEQEVAQLREAVTTARQIGMAIGLLAQRYRCTSAQAWTLLVRLSQNSNAKVREVARVVCEGYDGQSRPEDRWLLAAVAAQLPSGSWPADAHDGGRAA